MKKKLLMILMLIPLVIGGFATFTLPGDFPRMSKEELKAILGNPALLILDVRLNRDYMFSDFKIKGADRPSGMTMGPGITMGHITPSELPKDKDKTIVFYCSSPNEEVSTPIAKQFIERGYTKVYVLKGGWEEWFKADYPTEKK